MIYVKKAMVIYIWIGFVTLKLIKPLENIQCVHSCPNSGSFRQKDPIFQKKNEIYLYSVKRPEFLHNFQFRIDTPEQCRNAPKLVGILLNVLYIISRAFIDFSPYFLGLYWISVKSDGLSWKFWHWNGTLDDTMKLWQ